MLNMHGSGQGCSQKGRIGYNGEHSMHAGLGDEQGATGVSCEACLPGHALHGSQSGVRVRLQLPSNLVAPAGTVQAQTEA